MVVVLVTLGILVGFILAVVVPWALLRQLEHKGEGQKDREEKEG